ncbi:uncharacterized protein ARMOST_02022 [Armillaria ostoyae]|uniref:Uncharacterized protein n=1 Tax=Armillaria ostoyae TaxID=47428 RepID=A0A284QQN5_ARMOS|nr:uncharacterized protein ARMOST_02022 [Armillaria ostoyae]
MNATDAMFHLDAVARSVPEPVLPPNALNSQISGILRATRPFLDTDCDWILENIEVLQQQISVYDALLDRIDGVRSEMQRCRDVVHKSLAAYSSTLAPIRRLPIDILRTVFREIQLSMWSDRGSPKDHQALDFSQGPWNLGHVCGAWRDIVLSYPQLWSHLVLHFWESHPAETPHHTVLALKAMILRSAQHPLDIIFALDDDKEDAAVQAFSVILEESYRWRSMDLQMSLTLLEQLKVVRGKIHCLESLTMQTPYIPHSGREELDEDVRSVFFDAPRLQKVSLHEASGLGTFMFPHHITHLAACVDNVSNLEGYQSLIECHLETDDRIDHEIIFPHRIHLPSVRRLFVSSTRILAQLRLPSLDNLMVYGHDTPEVHTAVKMVNDFIYHSRCSLTRLATDSFVLIDQVFVKDCLSLMNTLVCLEIGLLWDMENIFNALASIGFLPNLQYLTLQLFSVIEPSLWDPFTAMISSRSQYLRSIRIFCSIFDDVERISERLAPLRPPGLQLIVSMRGNNDGTSIFEIFQSG